MATDGFKLNLSGIDNFTDEEWVAATKKILEGLPTTQADFTLEPPVHMPEETRNSLVTGSATLTIESAHDGTETVVAIVNGENVIAEGVAKRKKGDTRDRDLGLSLATMRAFQALADREKAFLKRKGFEE